MKSVLILSLPDYDQRYQFHKEMGSGVGFKSLRPESARTKPRQENHQHTCRPSAYRARASRRVLLIKSRPLQRDQNSGKRLSPTLFPQYHVGADRPRRRWRQSRVYVGFLPRFHSGPEPTTIS